MSLSTKQQKKQITYPIQNKKIMEKRRGQIREAAVKLFRQKGYHKTTMREIATESGLNLSQLYNYISSKDHILLLFYESLYEKIDLVNDSLVSLQPEKPLEELRLIIVNKLKMIHQFKNEFLTMYTESRHLEKESLKLVLSMENKIVKRIEDIISRGIKERVFKESDAFLTANIIVYLIMIEPLRGWNLKNKYSLSELSDSIFESVSNLLKVE